MSDTLVVNSSELGATAADWLALLKPRVLSLVVYTGVVGLVIAPVHMNPVLALTAILCIAVGAGAAGAINMWYDRDIDALMKRTASRAVAANLVAAGVLALSIGFYVFVYTMWLKRLTPQNIVIGGAAGAFPVVIGWTAATGSISALPLLLFAIVFFWTPPHFWALSLYACQDYERAGVPMLPVVKGARHTRVCVAVYALLLVPVSLAPFWLGLTGRIYGAAAFGLSAMFAYYCWKVLVDGQDAAGLSLTRDAPARAAFKFSILYLFLLFGACAFDRLV
jgi:protoheme IX farnesyltransferase